jgi:hypothetical protein
MIVAGVLMGFELQWLRPHFELATSNSTCVRQFFGPVCVSVSGINCSVPPPERAAPGATGIMTDALGPGFAGAAEPGTSAGVKRAGGAGGRAMWAEVTGASPFNTFIALRGRVSSLRNATALNRCRGMVSSPCSLRYSVSVRGRPAAPNSSWAPVSNTTLAFPLVCPGKAATCEAGDLFVLGAPLSFSLYDIVVADLTLEVRPKTSPRPHRRLLATVQGVTCCHQCVTQGATNQVRTSGGSSRRESVGLASASEGALCDALGPSLAMEMDVTFLHGDTMLVNSIPPFRPPRAVSPTLSLCRTLSSFVFSFHLWVPHAVSLPERPLRIFLRPSSHESPHRWRPRRAWFSSRAHSSP